MWRRRGDLHLVGSCRLDIVTKFSSDLVSFDQLSQPQPCVSTSLILTFPRQATAPTNQQKPTTTMHFPTKTAALAIAASAIMALSAVPTAFGHGYISKPAAVWQKGSPQEVLTGTIDNQLFGPHNAYDNDAKVKYFKDNFATSQYKTLRDLILAKQKVYPYDNASADCGYTIKDDAKRAILPSTLEYSHFVHPGPCEIWCDNTKLAYAVDCQATFKSPYNTPTTIPIDASKCAGADRLSVYWLGVDVSPWQVYNDCVWLQGSKNKSDGGNKATTKTPSPSSSSPAVPVPTTTMAPSSTKKSCIKKLRA